MPWGKIVGGVIGAAVGGPIGAGIGIALGAGWDSTKEDANKITGLPRSSSLFKAAQSDDFVRVWCPTGLPSNADEIVAYVLQRGEYVGTVCEPFADDEGAFKVTRQFVNYPIELQIPLRALRLQRDTRLALEIEIGVIGKEELLKAVRVPVEVTIDRQPWRVMGWLEPVVEIYMHCALRSGAWTADKVRLIKNLFGQIIDADIGEAEVLRDRLKQSGPINLDASVLKARQRFGAAEMGTSVLKGISRIFVTFNPPDEAVFDAVMIMGKRLGIEPEFIIEVLNDLPDEDDESHPSTSTPNGERLRAAETLGVTLEAGRDAIQAAWRKKISELHPDKYAHLPESVQALIKTQAQEINRARDILLA